MWSRRDQLQARQFLRRRFTSAVLVADANHPESPARPSTAATITGVVVTLLLLAGAGVYGVLRSGSATQWRAGGQVIVERETGAQFVLDDGGRLHPVLNYTSARLFLGAADARTTVVSRASLARAPRGLPLGIDGAPEAIPPATQLIRGPWAVCSEVSLEPGTATAPRVTAAFGLDVAGTRLGPGAALLVAVAGTGSRYLVTDGHRFLLPSAEAAQALGYGSAEPYLPVGLAWVNALPAGPDLRFITVPDDGAAGPVIGGTAVRVGQVFQARQLNGNVQYFVALATGLDRITQTEAQLIVARPGAAAGGQVVPLSAGQLAAAPVRRPELVDRGYPDSLPQPRRLRGSTVAACATATGYRDGVATTVVDLRASAPRGVPVRTGTGAGAADAAGRLADAVVLTPGRAAVVVPSLSAGANSGALYLVTDQGVRYPVPSLEVLSQLGLGGVTPTPVPAAMLELLPVGPRLDPADPQLHPPG